MDGQKHNELIFQLMVEASPNALILVNQKGEITYLNKTVEQLFNYDEQELIGQKLSILIPEIFKKSTNLQMSVNREFYALKKDDTKLPIQIIINPITTVEGTNVLATIIDITEDKEAELQLKQFEYFFNASLDFACIANVQGYFGLL